MRQKNSEEQVLTFQTRIDVDENESAILSSMACLLSKVEHTLFADLAKGLTSSELKSTYLKKFQITARHFNAVRVSLEGKISSIQKLQNLREIELIQRIASLEMSITKFVSKKAYKIVHEKKRRLANLKARLQKLRQEENSLCFGTKKLFRKQFSLEENCFASHAEWKTKWQSARTESFFLLGSKDETSGNQSCVASLEDGSLSLRIRLSDALSAHGKYLVIKNVQFAYGQETIEAALLSHIGKKDTPVALSYRFLHDEKGWRVFVSTSIKAPPKITKKSLGILGVDINVDHLAVVETDRHGNPIARKSFPLCTYGKTKHQASALIGDVVASIIDWCVQVKKPVVVERLSFSDKKSQLREISNTRYSRMLSSFSYSAIISMIRAKGFRCGVAVEEVTPAYTSIIGRVKFAQRYGYSVHESAALCIGRRYLGFSERLPRHKALIPNDKGAHVTLSLPVRNRDKHVWSLWRTVQRKLLKRYLQYTSRRIKRSTSRSFSACCDNKILEVVGEIPTTRIDHKTAW